MKLTRTKTNSSGLCYCNDDDARRSRSKGFKFWSLLVCASSESGALEEEGFHKKYFTKIISINNYYLLGRSIAMTRIPTNATPAAAPATIVGSSWPSVSTAVSFTTDLGPQFPDD